MIKKIQIKKQIFEIFDYKIKFVHKNMVIFVSEKNLDCFNSLGTVADNNFTTFYQLLTHSIQNSTYNNINR